MFDLHCHLLPGIDDGAATLAETLDIVRTLRRAGFRGVVATPHWNGPGGSVTRATCRAAVSELHAVLLARDIPFTLLAGGEHMAGPALEQAIRDSAVQKLGDASPYLLVELPSHLWGPPALNAVEQVLATGQRVLLAHPERSLASSDRPTLEGWVAAGVRVQLTLASLAGQMGAAPLKLSQDYLERGLAHVVATDTHSAAHLAQALPYWLTEVAARFGDDLLRRGLSENPRRILEGAPPKEIPAL